MKFDRKMNVLHLTTHLNIGGISSYLTMLAPALAAHGHRVSVVSSGGVLAEDLESRGIHFHRFSVRTKNEFHPKLFCQLPRLIRWIRKERFDLLHAHTRVTEVFAAAAARLTGVPLVVTAHGFYRPNLGRRIFPAWGDRVIAVSSLVAEELQKIHRVDPSRIRVVQNAVDTADFFSRLRQKDPQKVREEYGIPKEAVLVGSVSRLVRDKGHEFLLEALKYLDGDFPQVFVLIAGDGREKPRLEALASRYGFSKKVLFVPALRDVTGLLAAIDIFVHPATFREGFGLSIAEAMIAGKPVIATRVPALPSFIQDNVNGILVEPKSGGALANAIAFLLRNPEHARKIAENGFEMATSLCSLDRMVNEVEAVYREVLTDAEGPAS